MVATPTVVSDVVASMTPQVLQEAHASFEAHTFKAVLSVFKSNVDTVVEVWSNAVGAIQHDLPPHVTVFNTHPKDSSLGHSHLNPMQPSTYHTLSQRYPSSVLVLVAPHHMLDCLLPIIMQSSTRPIMAQVPIAWVQNGTPWRFKWLSMLQSEGRIITSFITNSEGLCPCAWLVLFPSIALRKECLPAQVHCMFKP
jgi:hypothetical protein